MLTQAREHIIAKTFEALAGAKHAVVHLYNSTSVGNGRLDAVSSAIKSVIGDVYTLETYSEHAIEDSTKSRAASYVSVKGTDGKVYWGAGVDEDIIVSSIKALVCAVNRMFASQK